MKGRTNLPQVVVSAEKPIAPPSEFNFKWVPYVLPISEDLTKIIYEGGKFVALGVNGYIVYSEDGEEWYVRKIGDYTLKDIIYVDGTYIVVGNCNNIREAMISKSQDLNTWETQEVNIWGDPGPYSTAISAILWNGNTYFLAGYSNGSLRFCKSSDLINFVLSDYKKSSTGAAVCKMLYANSRLVVHCTVYNPSGSSFVISSSDGITFSGEYACSSIFYINGFFEMYDTAAGSGAEPTWRRSINGETWGDRRYSTGWAGYPSKINPFNDTYLYLGSKGSSSSSVRLDHLFTDNFFDVNSTPHISKIIETPDVVWKTDFVIGANRIVISCAGGTILSANLITEDKELVIYPQIANQDIPLFDKDNIKMVHVKGVKKNIDSNIVAENIKEGISILGVTGTYSGIQ